MNTLYEKKLCISSFDALTFLTDCLLSFSDTLLVRGAHLGQGQNPPGLLLS